MPFPLVSGKMAGRFLALAWSFSVPWIAQSAHAHPSNEEYFGREVASCDFNADGYADLAIGSPEGDINVVDVGVVYVTYGAQAGLGSSSISSQTWHQDNLGMAHYATTGARFGAALGSGDFNGDGFCDLAVGAPSTAASFHSQAGMVNVLYGSTTGLRSNGTVPGTMFNGQSFTQDSSGVPDEVESFDIFGEELTTGDFNADGYADLVIGVPGEDFGSRENAGYVTVIFGSSDGLSTSVHPAFGSFQHWFGVPFGNEAGDEFGGAVAAGDFDGDGYSDLVVAAPGEDEAFVDVGRVSIFHGSAYGLGAMWSTYQEWTETMLEGSSAWQGKEAFGQSLTTSDFNQDGRDDLVIGVPGDVFAGKSLAGTINTLYGSPKGLVTAGSQEFAQDKPLFVIGVSETNDRFGWAIEAGDFDGDGASDLAIGTPFENVGGQPEAGFVNILYGSVGAGLSEVGTQAFGQDYPASMEDTWEPSDLFGRALGSGDFDGDGYADLAVGVPGEMVDIIPREGVVQVIYGQGSGLTATSNHLVLIDDFLP